MKKSKPKKHRWWIAVQFIKTGETALITFPTKKAAVETGRACFNAYWIMGKLK